MRNSLQKNIASQIGGLDNADKAPPPFDYANTASFRDEIALKLLSISRTHAGTFDVASMPKTHLSRNT